MVPEPQPGPVEEALGLGQAQTLIGRHRPDGVHVVVPGHESPACRERKGAEIGVDGLSQQAEIRRLLGGVPAGEAFGELLQGDGGLDGG